MARRLVALGYKKPERATLTITVASDPIWVNQSISNQDIDYDLIRKQQIETNAALTPQEEREI